LKERELEPYYLKDDEIVFKKEEIVSQQVPISSVGIIYAGEDSQS
jgi:hypothetical protein